MVQKEGKGIFEVIEEEKSNILLQCMDIDIENEFRLRCISCHADWDHIEDKRFKYIHGLVLTEEQLRSRTFMKSIERGLAKHVNENSYHLQSIEMRKNEH